MDKKSMKFEWDKNKRESNIEKHGIDFVAAMFAFLDINRIEREDKRKNYGEQRLQLIGKVKEEILFIVFTLRDSKVRIISARRAHKNEEKEYQEYL